MTPKNSSADSQLVALDSIEVLISGVFGFVSDAECSQALLQTCLFRLHTNLAHSFDLRQRASVATMCVSVSLVY